ncbi:YceI family protein [Kutzneria sp. NPDC052558]|uniref:YceI family protein n=1 Tax=Kutzneria sp. NPDC052558 TaxID=3364121 RepID=UPI0037C7273C
MGTPASGVYTVDPSRSTITFTTKHMFGLGTVVGAFAVHTALITVAGEDATVEAVIDAASVKTDQQRRDDHVRSKAFLHTEEHPTMDFVSDSVRRTEDGWLVGGVLTVRGQGNRAEFLVHEVDERDGELTARATATIDRYAHGVTAMKGMAGRRLALVFDITAVASDRDTGRTTATQQARG